MKGYVDVCGGKMNIDEVRQEIYNYMLWHKPKRMIIKIKRKKYGYHATIYIPEKDFKKEK